MGDNKWNKKNELRERDSQVQSAGSTSDFRTRSSSYVSKYGDTQGSGGSRQDLNFDWERRAKYEEETQRTRHYTDRFKRFRKDGRGRNLDVKESWSTNLDVPTTPTTSTHSQYTEPSREDNYPKWKILRRIRHRRIKRSVSDSSAYSKSGQGSERNKGFFQKPSKETIRFSKKPRKKFFFGKWKSNSFGKWKQSAFGQKLRRLTRKRSRCTRGRDVDSLDEPYGDHRFHWDGKKEKVKAKTNKFTTKVKLFARNSINRIRSRSSCRSVCVKRSSTHVNHVKAILVLRKPTYN